MDEVTQQNAALVEQSAAASQSMREQAEDLRRQISFFRLSRAHDERQAAPNVALAAPTSKSPAPILATDNTGERAAF